MASTYITLAELKADARDFVKNFSDSRLQLMIDNAERLILSKGLNKSLTGFSDAMKLCIIAVVETMAEGKGAVKSERLGDRSAVYRDDAVDSVIKEYMGPYLRPLGTIIGGDRR